MATRRDLYEDAIAKLRPYLKSSTSADLVSRLLGGNLISSANTNDQEILKDERKVLDPVVDLINGGLGIGEILESLKNTTSLANISSLVRITTSKKETTQTNNNVLNGISSYTPDALKLPGNESILYLEDGFTTADKFYPIDNQIKKESPAISVIEILDTRIGTAIRDTIGISLFTSVIPPHIASRAVPYVAVKIYSPTSLAKKDDKTVADSISIVRYLKGKVEWKEDSIDSLMFASKNTAGEVLARAGGMELFTAPQTMVTDHDDISSSDFVGVTPIDRFRPLMTLQSINFEQTSAGAGMISYKQGSMELVLHDRGRLSEISEFVKPGAFSSTEIEIEYGWSIDPRSQNASKDKNGKITGFALQDDVFAQFIDSLRVTEKYVVVNSTFNFDDAGQVNINMTLSMKGSQDIRSLDLTAGTAISKTAVAAAIKQIQEIAGGGRGKMLSDVFGETVMNAIANDSAAVSISEENLKDIRTKIDSINKNSTTKAGDVKELANLVSGIFNVGGQIDEINKAVDSFVSTVLNRAPNDKEIFFATEGMLQTRNSSKSKAFEIASFKKALDASDYKDGSISLGRLLLLVMGEPLASSKKFDEIQFIFNKVNDRAGFARGLSLAAFPLDRQKIQKNLTELYKKNVSIGISGFMSVIGSSHINSMTYPAYGFASSYDEKGELVNNGQSSIDTALTAAGIYDLNFVQPRLSIVPECVPGKNDKEKTILRLYVTDAACQPYLTYAEAILAMRSDTSFLIDMFALSDKHPLFGADCPNDLAPEAIKKERMDVINSLIKANVLVPLQKTYTDTPPPVKAGVQKEYNLDLTNLFKPENPKAVRNFMSEALPVIRYGGSYGMVKSITVASLSDPQLATINILKADEVAGQKESASKRKGLPMIVNPTEVTVEMLGCPLVNFGQSFYIDLGTNTSADNIYACVGISHKISPGDFTTSLKFVMNVGAYGIYNSSKRKIEITTKMLGEEARTLLLKNVDSNKISNLKSGQGDLEKMNLAAFKTAKKGTNLIRFINNPKPLAPEYIHANSQSFSEYLNKNPDAICYEVPLISIKNATSPITAKFYNQNVPHGIGVSIDITSIINEIEVENRARKAKKK